MERLDPEKNIFDIYIVDGDSNVQVEGGGGGVRLFLIGSILSTGQIICWISSLKILQKYLR